MVEEAITPDILAPKHRKIDNGMVLCPLEYVENGEPGPVMLDTCLACRNFLKIEKGKVMCAISWV